MGQRILQLVTMTVQDGPASMKVPLIVVDTDAEAEAYIGTYDEEQRNHITHQPVQYTWGDDLDGLVEELNATNELVGKVENEQPFIP